MKNLKVTVNGTAYDVQVEEVEASAVHTAPTVPAAAPAPAPAAAPSQAGGEIVESPMAGTVAKIAAAAGQQVRQNDTLLVLRTANGEIELIAPHAASVAGIYVAQGANVQAGTPLVSHR